MTKDKLEMVIIRVNFTQDLGNLISRFMHEIPRYQLNLGIILNKNLH